MEPRDELGRILKHLCLESTDEKTIRKSAVGLNDMVRKEGKLDGRSPTSVVAAVIHLVAAATGIELSKRALEEACGVHSCTITHVAGLIGAEPQATVLLAKLHKIM